MTEKIKQISYEQARKLIGEKSNAEIAQVLDVPEADAKNILDGLFEKYQVSNFADNIIPDEINFDKTTATHVAGLLTEREDEFFEMFKAGCSIDEIAEKLLVSKPRVTTVARIVIIKILNCLYPGIIK